VGIQLTMLQRRVVINLFLSAVVFALMALERRLMRSHAGAWERYNQMKKEKRYVRDVY